MRNELDDLPAHPDLAGILRRIAAGDPVDDRDFDRILPKAARKLARTQWTPLATAQRAALWLAPVAGTRVLDIGSGVGKMCLVGALTTQGVFTGVELEADYVALATRLAQRYRIGNARFFHRSAFAEDWTAYASLYLYNPFAGGDEPRFVEDVAETRRRLATLRSGARVVLHYGFGGELPPGYELGGEAAGGHLRLWIRR